MLAGVATLVLSCSSVFSACGRGNRKNKAVLALAANGADQLPVVGQRRPAKRAAPSHPCCLRHSSSLRSIFPSAVTSTPHLSYPRSFFSRTPFLLTIRPHTSSSPPCTKQSATTRPGDNPDRIVSRTPRLPYSMALTSDGDPRSLTGHFQKADHDPYAAPKDYYGESHMLKATGGRPRTLSTVSS